jgi:hypothetical protein
MLILNQNESNLIYWTKGWYENNNHENFWPQLKILHKDYVGCSGDIYDLQWYVRRLWKKILEVNPNKERLMEGYEDETLPSKTRYYCGAPNYGNTDWHCKDVFSEEQMVKARISVMVAQISRTETKLYESPFPVDLKGLRIPKDAKVRLEEMFNDKLTAAENSLN